MSNKLEFNHNGKVLYDKCIIGYIAKCADGWLVTDVRDGHKKTYLYTMQGQCLGHFVSRIGWKNYTRTSAIKSRSIRKNTNRRKRFALT